MPVSLPVSLPPSLVPPSPPSLPASTVPLLPLLLAPLLLVPLLPPLLVVGGGVLGVPVVPLVPLLVPDVPLLLDEELLLWVAGATVSSPLHAAITATAPTVETMKILRKADMGEPPPKLIKLHARRRHGDRTTTIHVRLVIPSPRSVSIVCASAETCAFAASRALPAVGGSGA